MKLKTKWNYNKFPTQTQNEQKNNMSKVEKPHVFSRPEHNLRCTEKK